MRIINKLVNSVLLSSMVLFLSGCAAGAATAGYALRAQSADSLSSEAEQRIVDRTKKEIKMEMIRESNIQI